MTLLDDHLARARRYKKKTTNIATREDVVRRCGRREGSAGSADYVALEGDSEIDLSSDSDAEDCVATEASFPLRRPHVKANKGE